MANKQRQRKRAYNHADMETWESALKGIETVLSEYSNPPQGCKGDFLSMRDKALRATLGALRNQLDLRCMAVGCWRKPKKGSVESCSKDWMVTSCGLTEWKEMVTIMLSSYQPSVLDLYAKAENADPRRKLKHLLVGARFLRSQIEKEHHAQK